MLQLLEGVAVDIPYLLQRYYSHKDIFPCQDCFLSKRKILLIFIILEGYFSEDLTLFEFLISGVPFENFESPQLVESDFVLLAQSQMLFAIELHEFVEVPIVLSLLLPPLFHNFVGSLLGLLVDLDDLLLLVLSIKLGLLVKVQTIHLLINIIEHLDLLLGHEVRD